MVAVVDHGGSEIFQCDQISCLSIVFHLKLYNFVISSSKCVKSTDWSALVSLTKPISIGLEAYRGCPRISQAGAILDSNSELGSPRQLLLSLLLLAGDIISNPGPQWKFPCVLVGFALNQLCEINEAFSVTTVIDGFIPPAVLLATKLMKPLEPHHVYGYAATFILPTTHLYHVILCWTHLIYLDFILHLQLRL